MRRLEDSQIFSSWLHGALLEMSKLQNFGLTQFSAARLLRIPVTDSILAHEIKKLEEAGLLNADENQTLKATSNRISTVSDVPIPSVRKYYREVSELASQASEYDLHEREFQCFSMAIRQSDLPKIKEEMRKFRSSLENYTTEDSGEVIYQTNLQFFPLTHAWTKTP